jgi:hypothetical protein
MKGLPAIGLLGLLAVTVYGLDIPAKTEISIRLKNRVSTQDGKAGSAVEALVIAPVMAGDQFAIPAGTLIHGVVEQAVHATKLDERSLLVLRFASVEVNGAKVPIQARVAEVDNAREKVDEQGRLTGILASETMTGQLDAQLSKLEGRSSGLASILNLAKSAVLKPADTEITYEPGVELVLQLTAPLTLAKAGGAGPAAQIKPVGDEQVLTGLIAKEPYQTMAQKPPKPSDLTNILLIGKEEDIQQAFGEAGWSVASALSGQSKLETFKALAENRGYKEAPVSVLLLDGQPPDLVFEKLNNTFAQRHHLRIWRRPATFQDSPVWAVAATHDTGISFSEADRTFIHRIDSQIDRERAKVVNDLILTGRVEAVEFIDRPEVPQHGQNATGDSVETDGRIAVLVVH